MSEQQSTTGRCPVDHGDATGDRLAVTTRRPGPAVEKVDGGWIVRSAEVARQVLRDGDSARQAGFAADTVDGNIRGARPLLYNFGASHRRQRTAVARYFTPKAVDTRYRDLMAREVDRAVATVSTGEAVVVDEAVMRYSVAVAREVVGLTESRVTGMARRLERFFGQQAPPRGTLAATRYQVVSLVRLAQFHLWDVRPAISARRHRPQDDVVSHLLEQGRSDTDILMEAVVYGAAGMVTTREFLTVALWHLLRDADLRRRYLAGEEAERYAILHELLRLEPVVGSLMRRLDTAMTVEHDGTRYTFAAGDLITIVVTETNLDETVVGACPVALHPGRPVESGYKDDVLSFGEGPHRCPGLFLATQESDMLLRALLALPLELVQAPRITTDPLLDSVVSRGLTVRLAA